MFDVLLKSADRRPQFADFLPRMGLKKKNPFKSAIENLRHPRSIKDKGQRTPDFDTGTP